MTETIFMIHGMWGRAWYWENYKSFFEAKGYHCITTTLRFHDMDPKETPNPQLGTASLLDYAGDLEEEIRQLGVKPILMGHSMGGASRTDSGEPRISQSPCSADSCSACWDHGANTIGDKEFLERTHEMGLLEKANAPDV